MKKLLFSTLTGLVLISACKKDNETVPTMQVSGTLSAAQSVPVVTSSAGSGTVTGTYNPTSRVLNYTVTYSGITPTAGHIHYGAPGKTGNVAIAFTSLTSPITGMATLTPMQADSLKMGHMYTNFHTTAHGDGEIRANMTVK